MSNKAAFLLKLGLIVWSTGSGRQDLVYEYCLQRSTVNDDDGNSGVSSSSSNNASSIPQLTRELFNKACLVPVLGLYRTLKALPTLAVSIELDLKSAENGQALRWIQNALREILTVREKLQLYSEALREAQPIRLPDVRRPLVAFAVENGDNLVGDVHFQPNDASGQDFEASLDGLLRMNRSGSGSAITPGLYEAVREICSDLLWCEELCCATPNVLLSKRLVMLLERIQRTLETLEIHVLAVLPTIQNIDVTTYGAVSAEGLQKEYAINCNLNPPRLIDIHLEALRRHDEYLARIF